MTWHHLQPVGGTWLLLLHKCSRSLYSLPVLVNILLLFHLQMGLAPCILSFWMEMKTACCIRLVGWLSCQSRFLCPSTMQLSSLKKLVNVKIGHTCSPVSVRRRVIIQSVYRQYGKRGRKRKQVFRHPAAYFACIRLINMQMALFIVYVHMHYMRDELDSWLDNWWWRKFWIFWFFP